ncbi:MAG: CYTH domain-containing protein, partial [Christensenellales bacterium]
MRNIQGLEEEKFYLSDDDEYKKVYDIISHMPNFVLSSETEDFYEDYFYDTKDKFLEQNRASVRVRKLADKQILSIKYVSSNALQEERVREAYLDMPLDADLPSYREAQLFLSNKINDIYAHYLDIDLVRKMRELKVYLVIYTDRTIYDLKNNRETRILVNFDRLTYQSKFIESTDNTIKFVLCNYPDKLNMETFQHFIK